MRAHIRCSMSQVLREQVLQIVSDQVDVAQKEEGVSETLVRYVWNVAVQNEVEVTNSF